MPYVTPLPPALCMSAEMCLLETDDQCSSPWASFSLFKFRTVYTQAQSSILGVKLGLKTNSVPFYRHLTHTA